MFLKRYEPKETEHINYTLTAFYAMIALMIVFGVVSPLFSVLAFIIYALYICVSKPQDIYLSMFFLVSFANIFKTSAASTSFFTYLIILAAMKLVFSVKKFNSKFVVGWLLLLIYILVGSNLDLKNIIKQALILPMVCFFFSMDKPNVKHVVLSYANGLILSSFVAQFKKIIPNMSKYLTAGKTFELEENVERFTGLYSDPNYYTMAVILAMSLVLVLYVNRVIGKGAYVYSLIFVFFGVQTVSKSFMLMLAFIVLFFAILLIKNKKKIESLIYIGLVLIVVTLIFNGSISIFDNIIERFLNYEGGDITTNRANIWNNYIEYLSLNFDKLIWGAGVGAPLLMKVAAHSTYIDLVYYYGVVGGFLFSLVLFFAFRNAGKIQKNIMAFFPMICLVINAAFVSCLMAYDLTFNLILACMVLTSNFKENQGNQFVDKKSEEYK